MNSSRHICSNWQAWYDTMPRSEPTLHVTAICKFSIAGYQIRLQPVEVGTNPPSVRQLETIVDQPNDSSAQVVTEVEVHYSEDTGIDYQKVQIDSVVEIPVEQTS